MNYFIYINFTSFHCTGRYELNKLTSLPMCGFIAQMVEHRTGIAEVTGANPVEALLFLASSFQLLKLEIYGDDHSLLSSTAACSTNMNYFIYINLTYNYLLFSPLHANPSPVNPFLHEQLYDPSVLLHVAFT